MSVQFCISEHETLKKVCCLPGSGGSCCLGSRCMAWRWVETYIKNPAGTSDLIRSGDTHGYCGLAGKPWGVK